MMVALADLTRVKCCAACGAVLPQVFCLTLAHRAHLLPRAWPQIAVIGNAQLGRNFVFSSLTAEEKRVIVDAMDRVQVAAGQALIQQGDAGDRCYVVETGQLDVFVNNVPVGTLLPGAVCGELALLYGCPRAATVRAAFPSTLWALDRGTFRAIVLSSAVASYDEAKRFLRSVKVFANLSDGQIGRLAEALQRVEFKSGTRIINQGDIGAVFYLIQRGRVRVVKHVVDLVAEDSRTAPSGADIPPGSSTPDAPPSTWSSRRHSTETGVAGTTGRSQRSGAPPLPRGAAPSPLPTGATVTAWAERPPSGSLDGGVHVGEVQALGSPTQPAIGNFHQTDPLPSARTGSSDVRQHHATKSKGPGAAPVVGDATLGADVIAVSDEDIFDEGEDLELMTLEAGSWFGEQALLNDEPRAASVLADGDVVCLALHRDHFFQLLGPLEDILRAQHAQRAQLEQSIRLTRSMRSMSGIVPPAGVALGLHPLARAPSAFSTIREDAVMTTSEAAGGVASAYHNGESAVSVAAAASASGSGGVVNETLELQPESPAASAALASASTSRFSPSAAQARSPATSSPAPLTATPPASTVTAVGSPGPSPPGGLAASSSMTSIALSMPGSGVKQHSYSSLRPTEAFGTSPGMQSVPRRGSAGRAPPALSVVYSVSGSNAASVEYAQVSPQPKSPAIASTEPHSAATPPAASPIPLPGRAASGSPRPGKGGSAARVPGRPSSPSSLSKTPTAAEGMDRGLSARVGPANGHVGATVTSPGSRIVAALNASTSNASASVGPVGPYRTTSFSEGPANENTDASMTNAPSGIVTSTTAARSKPAAPQSVKQLGVAAAMSLAQPAASATSPGAHGAATSAATRSGIAVGSSHRMPTGTSAAVGPLSPHGALPASNAGSNGSGSKGNVAGAAGTSPATSANKAAAPAGATKPPTSAASASHMGGSPLPAPAGGAGAAGAAAAAGRQNAGAAGAAPTTTADINKTVLSSVSTATRSALAAAPHPSFRVVRPDVRLSDLEPLALLGEGAFGLVRLVRHRLTGEVFALKQMQKARVVATNQQKNVMSEKRIMSRVKHPFVSDGTCVMQTLLSSALTGAREPGALRAACCVDDYVQDHQPAGGRQDASTLTPVPFSAGDLNEALLLFCLRF